MLGMTRRVDVAGLEKLADPDHLPPSPSNPLAAVFFFFSGSVGVD